MRKLVLTTASTCVTDERFRRPAEVDQLLAIARRRARVLGWTSERTRFDGVDQGNGSVISILTKQGLS